MTGASGTASEGGEDGDGREAIVGSNEIWPPLHPQTATQLLLDTTPKRRLSLNDVLVIAEGFIHLHCSSANAVGPPNLIP